MSQPKNNGSSNITTQEYNFPQKKPSQSFLETLYNSKDGTILGRNAKSWSQLLLFYTIFYIILAALFTICMQGLFSSLSETEPKWKLHESLIGTNPGLGFRPLPDETERGSIIQFDTKKPEEGKYWRNLLDKFLEPYLDHTKLPNGGKNQKFCSFNTTAGAGNVCAVDIETFGPCTPQNSYGYNKGRPCVFLKLNKIFNWQPDYYSDVNDLHDDMPEDLKDHIKKTPVSERNQIWVSCSGQHGVDNEKLGSLSYYPSRGFPAYYYPYTNQPGYLSPLLAVQFEKAPINELISIECRAWARNIYYSGSIRDRQGSVTFQLFVD